MPRKARLYIWTLTVLGAFFLYWFGREVKPVHWPLLLGMIVATVAFDLLRVELPTGQSFTLNSVVNTLAILLGGPPLAVWVAGIGQFAFEMIRESDAVHTLFNTGQLVVTVTVTGAVYQLLGGTETLNDRTLMAAAVAALVYFLVNSTLMATLFNMLMGKPLLAVWLDMVKGGVEVYLVAQILALVATYLIITGGIAWSVVWAVLLILLQRVLRSYYGSLRRNANSSQLQAMQDSLLTALVAALDARDIYTSGHSVRVAHYTELIAEQLRLPEEQRRELKYASILHDVGKLGIPDAVLRKDGPLSPTERALMMEHPDRGIAILGRMEGVPQAVLQMVKHHHEWVNGGGYPSGIQGEQIPLGAHIIAVADAFDAMTSARPYRGGMPWSEAISRLRQGRGTQFDVQVADAFLLVLERRSALEEEMKQFAPVNVHGDSSEAAPVEVGASGQKAGRILPVHSKEIEIIYRLAQERRSLLNLSQTLQRLLDILYDTVGPHLYYILLLDKSCDYVEFRASAGAPANLNGRRWPMGTARCEEMQRDPRPRVIPDVAETEGVPTVDPNTRSVLTVPLVTDNRVIGALQLESRHPEAFGQDEIYLLTAVAQQLADAIEVATAHELMSYAASHDGLTDTLNRTNFDRRLAEELARHAAVQEPLSVAILDLNNFKLINDTYGHLVGDRTIRAFGQYLSAELRPDELIARYGGDEFTIIMPHCAKAEASQRIEEIARRASTQELNGVSIPSAAWGIATYPEDGGTVDELMAAADRSMYEYKRKAGVAERAG
ncbi:MAG: diguanylate cyclase domain-containing protein [Mycobacterium leprae]